MSTRVCSDLRGGISLQDIFFPGAIMPPHERPGRKAAKAAQQAFEAQANERQVISDSDGGSDSEGDGEEQEESESSDDDTPVELSAYEMQREENMKKNKVKNPSHFYAVLVQTFFCMLTLLSLSCRARACSRKS